MEAVYPPDNSELLPGTLNAEDASNLTIPPGRLMSSSGQAADLSPLASLCANASLLPHEANAPLGLGRFRR